MADKKNQSMAMNKTYKRWLLAVFVIILIVLFFEWLVNRNRARADMQNENVIQHDANK